MKKKQEASTAMVPATKMENTLAVMTELNIGMDQMVSVGVAKLERQLKTKIKEIRATIDVLKKKIEKLNGSMPKMAEAALPDVVKKARKKFETAIKSLEIKDVTFDTLINVDTDKQKNLYELTMTKNEGNYYGGKSTIKLVKHSCAFTPDQKKCLDELSSMGTSLQTNNRMIVTLQQKLADAPAMERQMKARIVEQQLSTSEAGKQILDNMLANFDIDLEMLG